ncbi:MULTISPECIES: acyl-CoA dehydrogenase family protein [Caldilinea]|jgi:alkylation response protein AidB-like acyl-CoA dehydrogenase|uniref:Acyl-[acyl-carrier-protein] dehydrogenase MbtN n=1 Tax=Caldilinea aerophila (strain DSM 14535 / JCM 11387 / NBRC 104270 / STL-6-O1) TaxID=926550 RepID=I0I5H0_CALAS|nr:MULTISPECIES: acyl-CoA dehydrogenase family protein [Caldilinea]MBO9394789.1 acyl-CoA dehydrogenase family protein [Caldilinea sp.]BAM00508.1 acyl-CoA dehydrogenase [Caldilinea aerophila DSM 14535 = NBRC 104270]GIV71859.1 MAG: acyl-CoA dehydrogenase [Caldilinea sp.]
MKRTLYTDEHLMFRDAFHRFLEKEILPYHEQWERDGIVPREVWRKAGELGFLCFEAPEELGGLGEHDYRYHAVIAEELAYYGATGIGFGLHSSIVLPYILRYGTPEQQRRWVPRMVSGEWIGAIAMTEPAAGSDLAGIRTTALREGDCYIVNGQKTFITNGINSDLVITVVKTDPSQRHKGISLLVIERGMEGFTRGRNLEKIGLKAQDTAELFFDNVRVPVANLLGEEGKGFYYLMERLPQERLDIAVTAVAACEAALDMTVRYCKERMAFGQPIGSFQNSRFKLAEMKTEIEIARVFVDRCIEALNAGELTAEEAAMAKWWTTDLQKRVMDECLQLHGGYGYMLEYPIAKFYLDARVQAIYGGTNEIMKEVIGRGMGL